MRAYRKWTADEDAQLLFLHEHCGKPLAVIEPMLGRTEDAARGRYRVLRPRPAPVEKGAVAQVAKRRVPDRAVTARACHPLTTRARSRRCCSAILRRAAARWT